MPISNADISLGLALFDIFTKAKATLDAIRAESPEVYELISQRHASAQAAAKAVDAD